MIYFLKYHLDITLIISFLLLKCTSEKFAIHNRLITLKVRLHCGLNNQNMQGYMNFHAIKERTMLCCDFLYFYAQDILISVYLCL